MIEEQWKPIKGFPHYSVSDHGRVRSDKFDRILSLGQNQYGVVNVGMMRNGLQYHRSVPRLVALAFLPDKLEQFDTPINMDGDRFNNHVSNLAWRPRWFAVMYNRQFYNKHLFHIDLPIADIETGEISANSFECAKRYGLLETDVVMSITNRTYAWPTYQQFRVVEN